MSKKILPVAWLNASEYDSPQSHKYRWKNGDIIRIYDECEGGIEKSVLMSQGLLSEDKP